MPTLTSFHLFSHLPIELRLKIWLLAVEALPPRIVDLECLYRTGGVQALAAPALLRTTHESRSVALSTYQFWKRRPSDEIECEDIPYIYISPSTDIFAVPFCDRNFMPFGSFPDLALTYEWQMVRDIRERVHHLLTPYPQFGVTEDRVRAMFTPLTALERLDLSLNGLGYVEELGCRIQCIDAEEREGAEYFMTVMRGIDGLKIPVVRVVTVGREEDFVDGCWTER